MIDFESNYNLFKKYLKAYVTRDGIDNLLAWLDTTDFKIAPASTKYYLNEDGGLCKHSLDVFMKLINIINAEYPNNDCPYSKESIALVALLHDVGKVGLYKKYTKNVKNGDTGLWESVEAYTTNEDRFVFGTNEENSLFAIRKFLNLTVEEEVAIRYYGGAFAVYDSSQKSIVLNAYKRYKLALMLSTADLFASILSNTAEPTKAKEPATINTSGNEKVPTHNDVKNETAKTVSTNEENSARPTSAIDECPF